MKVCVTYTVARIHKFITVGINPSWNQPHKKEAINMEGIPKIYARW